MIDRPLVLFTHYYPFGDMELFLETEIAYLKEVFDTIIVVPNVISGPQRPVPAGVEVEVSFAHTHCGKDLPALLRKAGRALSYPPFYRELWHMPKRRPHLKKLLGYSSEAARCARWLDGFLRQRPNLQRALFYTYWFYDHTTAILQMKEKYPAIDVVSRAHGFDLYEEEYPPAYIPFRRYSLNGIDKLVLISNHGRSYVDGRFPAASSKLSVMRLGIEDPGFVINGTGKDALTVVSCSHLIPLKRVHLLIDGLASFARKHPDIPLQWYHIGDGPLKDKAAAQAATRLPPWVKWTFKGHIPNSGVFATYRELQPDLFLLTSKTEGLPVCIMEAHACGIPAIATDVGGVGEIVDNANGCLLSANPTPDEIGKGMASLLLSPQRHAAARAAARLSWETHFNAAANYRRFAAFLGSV